MFLDRLAMLYKEFIWGFYNPKVTKFKSKENFLILYAVTRSCTISTTLTITSTLVPWQLHVCVDLPSLLLIDRFADLHLAEIWNSLLSMTSSINFYSRQGLVSFTLAISSISIAIEKTNLTSAWINFIIIDWACYSSIPKIRHFLFSTCTPFKKN